MAGVVKARVELYRDGSCDVKPEPCPVEGLHAGEGERCYAVSHDGQRRACAYWSATTSPSNRHERMDVSVIVLEATARSARTIGCQVLCQRQKANRPPGC
jgi:hypothetical protein